MKQTNKHGKTFMSSSIWEEKNPKQRWLQTFKKTYQNSCTFLHFPITHTDHWGSTDDGATSSLHPFLFSTALCRSARELANSSPAHSWMLSSYPFFCRPLLLPPLMENQNTQEVKTSMLLNLDKTTQCARFRHILSQISSFYICLSGCTFVKDNICAKNVHIVLSC